MFGKKVMDGFKFKLGQTVTHISAKEWEIKEQALDKKPLWPLRESEQRWFIVERLSQECPGGIQRHYTCRGVGRSGSVTKEYQRFNEIELAEIDVESD